MDDEPFQLAPQPAESDSKPGASLIADILLEMRQDLITDLKQLNENISRVQAEYSRRLSQLQDKRKIDEEKLHHVEALLKLQGSPVNKSQSISSNAAMPTSGNSMSAADTAYNLLQEVRQPMHYREIARKLQERQVYIPGQDPAATLLSKMARDKRFKRTRKRGTYELSTWLAERSKARPGKSKKRKNK